MSSIYILEPPTSGKVLLKTTVGDIDVELWAKETPKTCRNFIQLCLEGYYDNTIFHRVVKGFIVQGGDPNGDGTGGESIYGEPFKDEFHQRLRFSRRGLLAMANAGKDDNASQFFFTLGPTPELQDKHTLFGKITGETIFNMLKLEEGLVREERPVYPHKIIKTEVLHNPFTDIEPRAKKSEVKEKRKKDKRVGVKNFKLLSFGAEAEEDEEESTRENEKFSGKGKSTHDVLDDPKLSSKTDDPIEKEGADDDESDDDDEEEVNPEKQLENIRKKLKRDPKKNKYAPASASGAAATSEVAETYQSYLEEERLEQKKRKYEEIQKEIQNVKKEYHKNKLKKEEEEKVEEKNKQEKSELVKEYKDEYNLYKSKSDALPKKGATREQFTLKLLEKFKKKLHTMKNENDDENNEEAATPASSNSNADEEEAWLRHRLSFQETTPVLAKDANKKDDDWFEIYDPRNPLNKRRRGEQTNKFKK